MYSMFHEKQRRRIGVGASSLAGTLNSSMYFRAATGADHLFVNATLLLLPDLRAADGHKPLLQRHRRRHLLRRCERPSCARRRPHTTHLLWKVRTGGRATDRM